MDSTIGAASELQSWLQLTEPGGFTDLIFFQQINDFLRDEIDEFMVNLLGRTAAILGFAVLSLLTLWITIQGYRIVTGQSRESMMALVTNSLRATLIVFVATGAAAGSSSIYNKLTDGVTTIISETVTGDDTDAYESIDRSLFWMQAALTSIDSLDVGGDQILNDKKDRALWFTGIGAGGPAITAGVMLLLNKIAMALFVGLGPLFILSLLFDQTKPLFQKWLFYGIGTLFSLAVLTVMVTLAMDMVVAVAGSFWVTSWIPGVGAEGVTSKAMQQGALGLILTMLIISAPPMAAAFFNGVLGQFSSYNQFAGAAGPGAQGVGSPPVNRDYSRNYGGAPRELSMPNHESGSRQSPTTTSSPLFNYGGNAAQQDIVKPNSRNT